MPYDINRANHAIDFIQRLTLTGNYQGKRFILRDFQRDAISQLFGRVKEDGKLQTKKLFLFLGRKQAKTTLASAILIYCLIGRGKVGQEIYSVASTRDQASLIFDGARTMIEADPYLKKLCEIEIVESKKKIVCKRLLNGTKTRNVYQALSSEGSSAHGLRPDVILFDEVHCQKTRSLWDAMHSSLGASLEPLTITLSTAGEDKAGLCRELLEYAKKVKDGIVKDDTFLPLLYYAEAEDDWTKEETWKKAMPALGDFCSLEFIREEFKLAQEIPANEYTFRTYYLNQFVGSAKGFMSDDKWMDCQESFKLEELYGKIAYAGLDCSSTTDFSAFVIVIPHNDKFYVHPLFWIPLNVSTKRERRDPALWRGWEGKGLVKLVEGDVLSRSMIADDIHELCKHFEMKTIAVDRAFADECALRLRDVYGYDVQWFSQSILSMAMPTVNLETSILSKEIVHDGNPVLRWMISNATTSKPDKNNNRQIIKNTSADKIDGVIAMLMGLDMAKRNVAVSESVYESRGLYTFEPVVENIQLTPEMLIRQRLGAN